MSVNTRAALQDGAHFELISGIEILDMSQRMHEIGLSLGATMVEHGLIGFGDPRPVRIHSEVVYHEDMVPFFMLGCVERATEGGTTILYDAVKAAEIIKEEHPDIAEVSMTFRAEHYEGVSTTVPLLREKNGQQFLGFRQKKKQLNDVIGLPKDVDEDTFYDYIDSVLDRCIEFEQTLSPGEVVVVDNYQTLHVRTAYTGVRKMNRVRVDDPEDHREYLV